MKPVRVFVALVMMASCMSTPERAASRAASPADASLARLAEELLRAHLAWRPQGGVGLGLHEYDGGLTDLSRDSIEKERARLHAARAALAAVDASKLSPRASASLRNLIASVDGEIFGFDVQRQYERNPMTYAGFVDVNMYVKRDFAPLPERVKSIISVLERAPDVFAAGRRNLEEKLPRSFVETAVDNGKGFVEFLKNDLEVALSSVTDTDLMTRFHAVRDRAAAEATDFLSWLEKERLPRSDDRFALGRDAFVRMLREQELITQSPEEILEIVQTELARETAEFESAARAIDPTKPAVEVFKSIQHDHPTPEGLIPETRTNLEAIRSFLVDRHVVTIPSEVRVKVEETPRYARATSFASMDTPGPFEKVATEAYYYVTPTEPEWTVEKKEEWLTSFNYYTTDVVTMHEAYPGHYVQFLRLNASDAARADKVFGSYAFIEGWAHYCEQMMIEQGFGSDKGALVAAKYRLAQSDEALLRICRACMAIRMHCDGWTIEQAKRFFMDHCHYEEAPAKSEATRGSYDPGYLFYTLGKLQLRKLRDDWRRQEGDRFSLARFHDEVTTHGMPPIRLLRELMLKDASTWGDLF